MTLGIQESGVPAWKEVLFLSLPILREFWFLLLFAIPFSPLTSTVPLHQLQSTKIIKEFVFRQAHMLQTATPLIPCLLGL